MLGWTAAASWSPINWCSASGSTQASKAAPSSSCHKAPPGPLTLQPLDGVQVQVVGGLIQQQQVGVLTGHGQGGWRG